MIKLFEKNQKEFNKNSIATIQPLKVNEIKQSSLNGWEIQATISSRDVDLIDEGMIAYIETKSKKGQPFVIRNITKHERTATFNASHVVFESSNYILEDVRPTNMSAGGALNYVNQRTDIASPYTTTSNVSNNETAYFIRKTLLEALITIEGRWGGQYDIDKYHINLKDTIGTNRGYSIRYGKNLQGITVFEDWSEVVTKLLPVGYDGITLPETYLYSDKDYGKPYTKIIKFETELEPDEETNEYDQQELILELRENAIKYLEENDVPKISYEVVSDVNQEMDIGDVIQVVHPVVGNLETKVISYEYNPITKRTTKLVFGNYVRSVKSKVDRIKTEIDRVFEKTSGLESVLTSQTDIINNMNKNGHVYIDDNQILILDALPKSQANHVWRWNMGGLAFSENGVEGPFKQAWTMDGTFNTEFIAANSIMTNQLHPDVGSSLDISSNESVNILIEDKVVEKVSEIEIPPGPPGQDAVQWTIGTDGYWYADNVKTDKKAIGEKGENGQPTYTWVKYADTPTSGMDDYPDGKKYIGLAFNKTTQTESTNYEDYQWSFMPQNITVGGSNLLINGSGELKDFTYWTFYPTNARLMFHKSLLYRKALTNYTTFDIVTNENSLSGNNLSFFANGKALNGLFKTYPDNEYGFRFKRVSGSQDFNIEIHEFNENKGYIGKQVYTFDNSETYGTISNITFESETSFFALLYDVQASFSNQLVLTELMFNVGNPKTYEKNPDVIEEGIRTEVLNRITRVETETTAKITANTDAISLEKSERETQYGTLDDIVTDQGSSITLLNNQVNTTIETRLTDAEGTLETINDSISTAENTQQTFTNRITNLEGEMTEQQTFFRTGIDGLTIGGTDWKTVMHADGERISFQSQAGNVEAQFGSNGMYVNRWETDFHTIEKFEEGSAKGTIFKNRRSDS